MSIVEQVRAWASSQFFANLNSPTSSDRHVRLIVDKFILRRWRAVMELRILDDGGTHAFRDRAKDLLPPGTKLCIVNPALGIDAAYRELSQVPKDFNAHLIMAFGVIEYYATAEALSGLLQQLFQLLAPRGVLLISETDPERGVGAWFGGVGHAIDSVLTGLHHWRSGDVTKLLQQLGYADVQLQPELVPNVLGGINPVWVMSAERPGGHSSSPASG